MKSILKKKKKIEKSKNRKKLIMLKLWSKVLSVTCASLLNESLDKKENPLKNNQNPNSKFGFLDSLDFSPPPPYPKTSCVLINCVLSV